MRILKKGNADKIIKPLQFTCGNCGCVFEANIMEYRNFYGLVREKITETTCVCPWCGIENRKKYDDR